MDKTIIKFKTFTLANAPHKEELRQNQNFKVLVKHTGRIILSKSLYEAMGRPEKLVVLQDSQYPKDFYLKSSQDVQAFPVKAFAKNQYAILSNTLSNIIASPHGYSTPPLLLEVHRQSTRRWFILPLLSAAAF